MAKRLLANECSDIFRPKEADLGYTNKTLYRNLLQHTYSLNGNGLYIFDEYKPLKIAEVVRKRLPRVAISGGRICYVNLNIYSIRKLALDHELSTVAKRDSINAFKWCGVEHLVNPGDVGTLGLHETGRGVPDLSWMPNDSNYILSSPIRHSFCRTSMGPINAIFENPRAWTTTQEVQEAIAARVNLSDFFNVGRPGLWNATVGRPARLADLTREQMLEVKNLLLP